jgi:LemA protein
MKKGLLITLVIIIILAIIIGWAVGSYNKMVTAELEVDKYASDIQADLQRRADLIPNLVKTVQGYAKHEKEIFTAVANARAQMMSAGNLKEAAAADTAMNSALSRLLAVAEAYPELKANENFINLQTQLEGTENRIKVARTKYNEAVQGYNTMIRRVPYNIMAGIFGFEAKAFFEATAGSETVPEVSF